MAWYDNAARHRAAARKGRRNLVTLYHYTHPAIAAKIVAQQHFKPNKALSGNNIFFLRERANKRFMNEYGKAVVKVRVAKTDVRLDPGTLFLRQHGIMAKNSYMIPNSALTGRRIRRVK